MELDRKGKKCSGQKKIIPFFGLDTFNDEVGRQKRKQGEQVWIPGKSGKVHKR